MSDVNEDYWYNQWHLDTNLHKEMKIKNVSQIDNSLSVSVYGDTDSIFVGFKAAIDSCEWKNQLFNDNTLSNIPTTFKIIKEVNSNIDTELEFDNTNFKGYQTMEDLNIDGVNLLIVDGNLLKNWDFMAAIKDYQGKIFYNWKNELEFVHGLDKFRIEDFFKDELTKHAATYGVENVQDFELEKIAESTINLEKKKYLQHLVWEDGIDYKRLDYFQPKGVELVRSSTPAFARNKEQGIPKIVKYLFANADTFTIKELLRIIKAMRREFELADINDISMQSSCNKYNEKVISDKDKLVFIPGAHFGVKAAGYYNWLLNKPENEHLQTKYHYLSSGNKIKYYYTKNAEQPIFAFHRGEYPIEFAPEINYDLQFQKAVLNPVNNIIKKLGMPEITKRLSVVLDIFSGL
jgi:hypothetical protein